MVEGAANHRAPATAALYRQLRSVG